jgi:hypothetical protein
MLFCIYREHDRFLETEGLYQEERSEKRLRADNLGEEFKPGLGDEMELLMKWLALLQPKTFLVTWYQLLARNLISLLRDCHE